MAKKFWRGLQSLQFGRSVLGKWKKENLGCVDPKDWNWMLVIRVPDFIRRGTIFSRRRQLRAKGKAGEFEQVKLESLDEGSCVQMLHVGPYNQEHGTIGQMLAFAQQEGLTCRGKHHEIYLSDPRRVPPDRLRTICGSPWCNGKSPWAGPHGRMQTRE